MAAKEGQRKSEKYKASRKTTGNIVKAYSTKESRSKGGKAASKNLVNWQKKNAKKFKKMLSEKAKKDTHRKLIPHIYLGIKYPSKKALQAAHKMSICGFYGKLKRGEIKRLPKEKENAGQ